MPNLPEHEALCRLFLGDPCTRVHREKDAAWALRRWGPSHRRYGHGLAFNLILGVVNGWTAREYLGALLHDWQDGVLVNK